VWLIHQVFGREVDGEKCTAAPKKGPGMVVQWSFWHLLFFLVLDKLSKVEFRGIKNA
jgi:hypothetical protein